MYQYRPELKAKGISPGGSLKGVRELRKMSVDSLAELSGVAGEQIINAERNAASLNVEQIERLALALSCHPASLAFPYWDTRAYEPSLIKVEGELLLNGVRISSELNALMSRDFGLSVHDGGRKRLSLYTLSTAMLTGLGHAPKRSSSLSYTIAGDIVGNFTDTYQSGPDFDGDSRAIKKVELKIAYSMSGVLFGIEGIAHDQGMVLSGRPATSPPGDWAFAVTFSVPREKIQEFYGLYPSAAEFLRRDMDALGVAR